jgi:hypothetical protein
MSAPAQFGFQARRLASAFQLSCVAKDTCALSLGEFEADRTTSLQRGQLLQDLFRTAE